MLTATQFVATLCSALFTGAAIYINLVEHPARMSCDTTIAATVWAPSYQRGAVMQAALAILSFMAGPAGGGGRGGRPGRGLQRGARRGGVVPRDPRAPDEQQAHAPPPRTPAQRRPR